MTIPASSPVGKLFVLDFPGSGYSGDTIFRPPACRSIRYQDRTEWAHEPGQVDVQFGDILLCLATDPVIDGHHLVGAGIFLASGAAFAMFLEHVSVIE